MEHPLYQERLTELGLSIPEQIKCRGISSTYIYPKGSAEIEPDSSQWCPVARTRHHGHKAECRKVPVHARNFFPAKVNLVKVAFGRCALSVLGDIPGRGPGTPALGGPD